MDKNPSWNVYQAWIVLIQNKGHFQTHETEYSECGYLDQYTKTHTHEHEHRINSDGIHTQ